VGGSVRASGSSPGPLVAARALVRGVIWGAGVEEAAGSPAGIWSHRAAVLGVEDLDSVCATGCRRAFSIPVPRVGFDSGIGFIRLVSSGFGQSLTDGRGILSGSVWIWLRQRLEGGCPFNRRCSTFCCSRPVGSKSSSLCRPKNSRTRGLP